MTSGSDNPVGGYEKETKMTNNYAKIVSDNLARLYANLPQDLAENLPAIKDGDRFVFEAFGGPCVIAPDHITLGGEPCAPVLGILISLYALNARPEACVPLPLRAFKEFPGSAPYVGAFATHTEQVLAPRAPDIKAAVSNINAALKGGPPPADALGDFAFLVTPLPKIRLCYIVYEADDEFPASVTCLFSNNADRFMPTDGLADVGEYTSRKILGLMGG